jgi:hypothetical protein
MYRLIAAVIVAGLFLPESPNRPRSETQRENAGLAALARERDFLIGAAVSAPALRDEADTARRSLVSSTLPSLRTRSSSSHSTPLGIVTHFQKRMRSSTSPSAMGSSCGATL